MSDVSSSGIPAGWYPDPQDATQVRWWSGTGWTEHVAPRVQPAEAVQVQEPAQVQAPLPSRRALRESGTTVAASAPIETASGTPSAESPAATEAPAAVDPFAVASPATPSPITPTVASPSGPVQWDLRPSLGEPGAPAARIRTVPATGTATAWIIALSPAIAGLALGYEIAARGLDFGAGIPQTTLAVSYLLVLLLAVIDRRQLLARGHDPVATWIWAALSAPIYLLARNSVLRNEGASARGPLILCVVAIVLVVAGTLGYGLLTGHPLLSGLPG